MPDSACSASIPDAQAPHKITDCLGGCGAKVPYRTNSRVYCSDCRAIAKREKDVRAAEKQRRKKGIPKVQGEIFPCAECGCAFTATSKSRAKYCPECRPIVSLRHSNASSKRRITDPARRDRFNEWFRERGKDPLVAISRTMRTYMYRELGRKSGKRGRWFELVGYTAEELKDHLERQFLPGMTWGNRGEWHIDHIIPIASFNYDGPGHPDFKACWALTNLRPIWAADNIRKKDKILYLL